MLSKLHQPLISYLTYNQSNNELFAAHYIDFHTYSGANGIIFHTGINSDSTCTAN